VGLFKAFGKTGRARQSVLLSARAHLKTLTYTFFFSSYKSKASLSLMPAYNGQRPPSAAFGPT
jgi:hypothetical protein